jgi:hypothetical protein
MFYPNASSYRSQNLASVYRRHEQAKKREYGERIRNVERGVFTPLVLSTTGGMGREAETFYKCFADMISNKRQQKYSATIGWLRCRMSFASLRSSIMCIRGSRSSIHRSIFGDSNISLATSEARTLGLVNKLIEDLRTDINKTINKYIFKNNNNV